MLKQLNTNLEQTKSVEQAQAALAFDRKETFQEFLVNDKEYQRDLQRKENVNKKGARGFRPSFRKTRVQT
jgi:hypothetical protein